MAHSQVVYNHAFILSLFPTPWAEGQTTSPSQGLGGIWWRNHLEEMDVLWGTFCHTVSNPEFLLTSPYFLDFMDIRAHEASRGGHLLEGVGEVVGPLMVIVGVVCLEICPPSCSDRFRVIPKGFPVALLEESCQEPLLFLPLAWPLLGSGV